MKNKFEKINPILDKEHEIILNTIDKLYKVCEKHWKTEAKMYKEGLKKIPKGHPNTTKQWKNHEKKHKTLLKQIKTMKSNIIKHIKEDDKEHFHWKK